MLMNNRIRLKKDNPPQRNCKNQFSPPSLPHIKQECHESLIQRQIHIQHNSNKDLKYSQS